MVHIENKHIFRTLGSVVLIPEDLLGSQELRALSTSSSDMFIETKCCLMKVSILTLLFVDMRLLVENTE